MLFSCEKYLPVLSLVAIFSAVKCTVGGQQDGQYGGQGGSGGGYNDLGNKDDEKYPFQPYGFGYDIEDGHGNKQWRHEKSQNPSNVMGSYGFKDKDGIMREVEYVADKNGFRAKIKTNEPGTAPKDPGDVKFDAQPVIVPYYNKHGGGGAEQGGNGGGHDGGQDYKYGGQESVNHQKIQHRMGNVRVHKLRAAGSQPRRFIIPYAI